MVGEALTGAMPRHFTPPNPAARHPFRRRIPLATAHPDPVRASRPASLLSGPLAWLTRSSFGNPEAGHPLRRRLPAITERRRGPREDTALFLVSFAAAFVILWSFVV